MNFIYNIIYHPKINWLIRNISYCFFWLLPGKMKIHPSGILKVTLKGCPKRVLFKTNQTNYLTKLLFWERSKGFEYTSLFLKLIKKVDVFMDVGANIGYYSIIGSITNPNLKVIAFEPSIGVMKYLSENIKINDLEKQITVEVMALSDQIGEVEFHELKNEKYPAIYNLSGEHNMGTKPHKVHYKVKAKSSTLNNYVKEKQLKKIDLIKLDTEGNEDVILTHANEIIKKFRPIIICETLFNTIEESLEKIMSQHNYKFYNHTEKGLVKVNSIKRKFDDGIRNCFFVPNEKEELIKDLLYK